MISIQQMQYIVVLSETRHFQRASELCFITQPTLSMQVKKAEDELGFPIFDRSRQPLELTAFGAKLIPILREILSESEKIGEVTAQMKGTYRERIKLGIIPTISSYMLPDLFQSWKKEMDDIQLAIHEMKSEELIAALDRKELDMIILAGPYAESRLRTIPLYTEEILAFTNELTEGSISTEQLNALQPWLLSSGNCLRNQMVRICQLSDDPEADNWTYEGGNMELLVSMTEKFGGYTLVPEHLSLGKERKKQLHRIAGKNELYPAREIIAVLPSRSLKWSSLERIVRSIQLKYGKRSDQKFELLSWRS